MDTNLVSVPISMGELCDKYTILQIKAERIQDVDKLAKIHTEMCYLKPLIDFYAVSEDRLKDLKKVNETLWDIEDAIRVKESNSTYDDAFIQLARSVYITNDHRFELKSIINALYKSDICEVKSYAKY
jgi:hypothetical protein